MGSNPIARLRRTISETQGKAVDILRQLKASTHPPPVSPPEEEEKPVEDPRTAKTIIPPAKKKP